MSAPAKNPRAGLRVPSLRGGPAVPLAAVCAGVVALTAAVTLGGEDSSSPTQGTGAVTAAETSGPAATPARNSCLLRVGEAQRPITVAAARTLTQVAAVGWQVKAPEEMVARVLDVASARPGTTMSVTDALDLFTREDPAAPSAASLADIRALFEPGALSCVYDKSAVGVEAKGSTGLTPRTATMRQGVIDAFGKLNMTGFGGKRKTSTAAEAAGRVLDVTVPAVVVGHSSEAGAGWVLAHWLTARGADYKLDSIAYDDHVWAPTSGWQTTTPGQPSATPARPGRVYVVVTPGTAPSKSAKKSHAKAAKNAKRSKRS